MESTIKHSALGDLIRRHLELTNETQGSFAKRAGLSEGTVSNYLSGRDVSSWPKQGGIEKIASALGIPPDLVAVAVVTDLGYQVTEQEFSPHESLVIGMMRNADEAERDRVVKIIRAALDE